MLSDLELFRYVLIHRHVVDEVLSNELLMSTGNIRILLAMKQKKIKETFESSIQNFVNLLL